MDLFPLIENARPHLKKNSITNYIRNINILHDRKPYENLDWLKDTKAIQEKIESKKKTSQRNYIVSIVVALQSANKEKYKETIDTYQALLKELTTDINSTYEKHEKTSKENENWLNYSELTKIQRDYKAQVDEMQLNKKTIINPKDNKVLLYYLISSLYTLHNPLRLDWATLRVITSKKDLNKTENFLLKTGTYTQQIILNDFKNVSKIGSVNFKLSRPLTKVINLYRRFNKGEYLLMNTRGFKMSQNSLSKMIPLIFQKGEKRVNLNMIRKSKIQSEVDIEQVKKEEALAESMLHSEGTQKGVYLKKSDGV
jgi:hypothetical protein